MFWHSMDLPSVKIGVVVDIPSQLPEFLSQGLLNHNLPENYSLKEWTQWASTLDDGVNGCEITMAATEMSGNGNGQQP